MFRVDAGLNRVTVGSAATAGTFNVTGNSYHSDDIYLRDGAVNGGDILVRIFDSSDDGIIDVYQNNAMNHRIHGNGTTIFNEQGLNLDFRVESDGNAAMLFVDASTNRVGLGTTGPSRTLDVNGNARIRTIPSTTSSTVTPLYTDASGNIYKKNSSAASWATADYDSGWFTMNSQAGTASFQQRTHGLGAYPSKVLVLVRATSGNNNGYIFEASGVAQGDDDDDNHYGGVLYAYNTSTVRLWAPDRNNGNSHGRIISINDGWGGEQNTQLSNSAQVRVLCWR
jgi:hypothetical protein